MAVIFLFCFRNRTNQRAHVSPPEFSRAHVSPRKGRTFEFSRQLPTSPLHWQLPTMQGTPLLFHCRSICLPLPPSSFHCRSIFLPLPPSSFHCRSIFLPLPPSASSIKQLPSASTIAGQEGNGGGIVEQLPSVCQENGGGIMEQLPSVCQASPW